MFPIKNALFIFQEAVFCIGYQPPGIEYFHDGSRQRRKTELPGLTDDRSLFKIDGDLLSILNGIHRLGTNNRWQGIVEAIPVIDPRE